MKGWIVSCTSRFRRPAIGLAILLAGSLAAAPVSAQQPTETSGGREHAPVVATLAQIAWLSGSYSGPGIGGQVEEHWTKPAGESIVGMFRLVGENGKTVFCEFMMIEQEGPHVVGRFRHFGPKHKPWEPLDSPLLFNLVDVTANRAVFETATTSSPKRLTYQKTSPGRLSIRLQSEKNGVLDQGIEFSLAPTVLGQ